MKKLSFIIFFALFAYGCSEDRLPTVNLVLDQVLYKNNSTSGFGSSLEFDLYLERTDLGIKQPYNEGDLYTVDLPLELQPKYMYLSDLDDKDPMSGSMCDRPRFPHRCSISNFDLSKSSKNEFLIKITFEDGAYAEDVISVPLPPILEIPLITYPEETPAQSSPLKMAFRDVGADYYEVSVNLCGPYMDDGINPCLDGVEYVVSNVDDELVFKYEDNFTNPKVEYVEDLGIKLTSDFPLIFEEGVAYSVTAIYLSELENGVKTYSESNYPKYFEF